MARIQSSVCITPECDRKPHANDLCSYHYRKSKGIKSKSSTALENAETLLRKGGTLSAPESLPYHLLARTCRSCGDLVTTPFDRIHKSSGPIPRCHPCHIKAVRAAVVTREKVDEEFRTKMRRRADRIKARTNRKTLETATRNGQQWTGPELEIACRPDLSARQAAEMLGRSFYAVKHARQKITEPKWAEVAGLPRTTT